MAEMDNFLEGNGIIILILFFLMFGMGGFGFGGNGFNAYNDVARESTMNTQFIERDIQGVNSNVLENRYANQLAECQTQKEVLLGNANLQKDILLGNQKIGADMAGCCCEIKNAIRDDGEKTRALISGLDRERLLYELNQANTAIANAVQTQNILGTIGTWRANPTYPVYPNNYGYYGTTIA